VGRDGEFVVDDPHVRLFECRRLERRPTTQQSVPAHQHTRHHTFVVDHNQPVALTGLCLFIGNTSTDSDKTLAGIHYQFNGHCPSTLGREKCVLHFVSDSGMGWYQLVCERNPSPSVAIGLQGEDPSLVLDLCSLETSCQPGFSTIFKLVRLVGCGLY